MFTGDNWMDIGDGLMMEVVDGDLFKDMVMWEEAPR